MTGTMVVSTRGVRLIWTPPGGQPQERALGDGELTIGRGEGCDIVVDDPTVSRTHARLTRVVDAIVVEDLGSRNGTMVNGDLVARAELRTGDTMTLGRVTFELGSPDAQDTQVVVSADGATMSESRAPSATLLTPLALGEPATEPEDPVTALLRSPIVSEQALAELGIDVKIADVLALGSGLGSFVFVDALRVSGVARGQIVVLGNEKTPFGRYQRLCRNSQIPPHERLRSNSDSCPDNVWGFPGYAVREMWGNLKRGDLGTTARVLWSIFGESAIADTYTPRSGDVFDAVAAEARRIDWEGMLQYGRIRTIRKTAEGRILAIASAGEGTDHRRFAVSAPIVHLSLGYPSIQLLPDLAEYRERTGDRRSVANAYEPHDHMYEQLRARGGSIILRGRGIVASRVLQRLWEDRRKNANITVIHLHRSPLKAGRRYGWSQRKIHGEFEFQAFNWPKGCWTGPQRYALEAASPEERKRLLELWGGTTTANRRDWRNIVSEGLSQGWYRQEYGVVRSVEPTGTGQIRTRISNSLSGGGALDLDVDFMIDCTGLVASPDRAPVLEDLIDTYDIQRNPYGRFHVTNDFELTAMRHGGARMFAAGATTLGGPFATVDSFLGLQYAGLRAVNAIADTPVPGQRRLSGLYSFGQWLKWARRVAP